jgi:hypothetical protein
MAAELARLGKRTLNHLEEDDAIEEICKHISSGGSLIDYCRGLNLRFCDVTWWLQQDAGRYQQYRSALAAQKTWMIEALCGHLVDIASFDFADITDPNGEILPPHKWPERARKGILGFAVTDTKDGQRVNVKRNDPMKAIEMLAKIHGLLKEQVELSGNLSLSDMVTEAANRMKEKRDTDADG